MLPLLLAILFFSIGWITYNFLGGQCAACDNGHGLPLFYAVTGLLGVACLAAPVCLLVKRARFIGWGLLLAVLLTMCLVTWYVTVITAGMD